jgi:hypothetical protein
MQCMADGVTETWGAGGGGNMGFQLVLRPGFRALRLTRAVALTLTLS